MTRYSFALIVAALTALPGFAQTTRVLTRPDVPDVAALDRLNLRLGWKLRLPVDGRRDGIGLVQQFDDQLFIQLRNGALFAVNAETGAVTWQARIGDPYPVLRPVGANDDLLLVMNGTRVHGLNRVTGAEEWVYDLPAVPSVPAAADHFFLYSTSPNGVLAVFLLPESKAGEKAKPAPEATTAPAPVDEYRQVVRKKIDDIRSQLNLVGSVRTATVTNAFDTRSASSVAIIAKSRAAAVLTNRDGRGTSLAQLAARPEVLWSYPTRVRNELAPVLYRDGFIFQVSSQTTAVGLDVLKQKSLYEFQADANLTAVDHVGTTAYVSAANATLHAIDLETGRVKWRFLANGPILPSPVATFDDVYLVAGLRGLVRIDRASGLEMWQTAAASRFIAANPKFVYAEDRLGKMLVLDRRTGEVLARFDALDFTVSLANNRTDRVILGAHDGLLVSLHDRSFVEPLNVQDAPPAPAKKADDAPADAKPAGDKKPEDDKG